MPFDANGNYSLPAIYKATPGQTIFSVQHNTPLEDIQAALNAVLMRDGRVAWTGNQNANGYKLTGLADGADNQDAATMAQLAASQKLCLLLASTALQTVSSDVTFTGAIIVPAVTDFTAETALGAKTAEARYIQSTPAAGSTDTRIGSIVENADSRAVLEDGGVLALLSDLPMSDPSMKLQVFTVTGDNSLNVVTSFPKAFKPGTKPIVFPLVNSEPNVNGFTRVAHIGMDADYNERIDNTGFTWGATYLGGNINGNSAQPFTLTVIAAGVYE